MIASALCIVVGTALVSMPAQRFTLRWQHTVEKVLWEEDYFIAGEWLYAIGARVRGSGAGMEPPPGAVNVDGVWHYRPRDRWLRQLDVARSEFGQDYELCVDGRCRELREMAPLGRTTLHPCAADQSPRR
jgi:hypothetical protein